MTWEWFPVLSIREETSYSFIQQIYHFPGFSQDTEDVVPEDHSLPSRIPRVGRGDANKSCSVASVVVEAGCPGNTEELHLARTEEQKGASSKEVTPELSGKGFPLWQSLTVTSSGLWGEGEAQAQGYVWTRETTVQIHSMRSNRPVVGWVWRSPGRD